MTRLFEFHFRLVLLVFSINSYSIDGLTIENQVQLSRDDYCPPEYKLCRDETATSPTGTITLSNAIGDSPRLCYFDIAAPVGQLVQITCANVYISSWMSYFSLRGMVETIPGSSPVVNRVYTSYHNKMGISAQMTNADSVNCNWTMISIPATTTDFKLCLHGYTTASRGTVRPIEMSTGETRDCRLFIEAPSNQRVQMTCSSINLGNSPTSYMRLRGQDTIAQPPIVNRIYTTNEHYLDFDSRITNPDWFQCKWEMITPSSTTGIQTDETATSWTGKITISNSVGDSPKECYFDIYAPVGQYVQMTCSDVYTSVWTNYFLLRGTVETFASPPVLKRIYTSYDNRMGISSRVTSLDRVNCNWEMMTIPSGTTDFKFCIHGHTKASSGTIRPLDMSTGETRWCRLVIEAPYNQRVQLSCSTIKLNNSPTSFMRLETLSAIVAEPPVANNVYTSSGQIFDLSGRITNPDWFECKWTFV